MVKATWNFIRGSQSMKVEKLKNQIKNQVFHMESLPKHCF